MLPKISPLLSGVQSKVGGLRRSQVPTSCSPRAFGVTTRMLQLFSDSRMKAIHRPSGDQAGDASSAPSGGRVSWRGCVCSVVWTMIAVPRWPSGMAKYATRPASGDNAGESSKPGAEVIRR